MRKRYAVLVGLVSVGALLTVIIPKIRIYKDRLVSEDKAVWLARYVDDDVTPENIGVACNLLYRDKGIVINPEDWWLLQGKLGISAANKKAVGNDHVVIRKDKSVGWISKEELRGVGLDDGPTSGN